MRTKTSESVAVVLDKSFPRDKKTICQDEIIERIYYERDKNSAHKDENFHAKQYETHEDIENEMQK